MIVEMAVGDAYGAGFEFADDAYVESRNDLSGYVVNPRHPRLRPGSYTDDTQMSVAIAEHLLAGAEWSRDALADRFVAVFRRDPREGYSRRMHAALTGARSGRDLVASLDVSSVRSGAAMRAGPVGLLPEVDDVLQRTEVQARVTHDTAAAVMAAQAAALAVHYCHHEVGEPAELGLWIAGTIDGAEAFRSPWTGQVDSSGVACVRAAVTALSAATGMADLLRMCVSYTGDVDTVAAIALAAASRSSAVAADLPAVLVTGLENGDYGRSYLERVDAALLDKFGAGTVAG